MREYRYGKGAALPTPDDYGVREPARCKRTVLEPRIDRLAFQCQHGEDAFMDPAQRLARDKALQGLMSERKLAQCQIALAREAARTKPGEVLGRIIFRPVDDP